MSRKPKDWIPDDVMELANRAGLPVPTWYAGRTNGHEHHERKVSLRAIFDASRRDASSESADAVPPGEKPDS